MRKSLCALLIALVWSPIAAQALQSYYANGASTPANSDYRNNYSLAINTAQQIVWPINATVVNINCPSASWSSLSSSITVPAATVTNGTGAALNMGPRVKGGESSFYIISATAQVCSAEFWSQWGGN